MSVGWKEGGDPSPDFSTSHYLRANGDVAGSGINPFFHYLRYGELEARSTFVTDWGKKREVRYTTADLDCVASHVNVSHVVTARPDLAELSPRAVASWWLVVGWAEHIDPAPGIAIIDIAARRPEAVTARFNPLLADLMARSGGKWGSVITDAKDRLIVADHFDAAFYRDSNSDLAHLTDSEALDHFMNFGWREGRDPTNWFSTLNYLAVSPDLVGTEVNPFLHFILFGKEEGRHLWPACVSGADFPTSENPAEQVKADNVEGLRHSVKPEELEAVRNSFEPEWYRATYDDVSGDAEALLIHYMTVGWREGRDPSPAFSTNGYLARYADIALSGSNPLLHYVLFGRAEGRRPDAGRATAVPHDPLASDLSGLPAIVLAEPPEVGPHPPSSYDPGGLKLHWVIPDFTPGSGGHMTIFRMIRHLESAGHHCRIWIETSVHHSDAAEAWDDIVKHFVCLRAEVAFLNDGFFDATGDIVIATGWSTAYAVEKVTGFLAKCYFVQDHEPEFYATGAESILARETYRFDFGCICASPWLRCLMQERYGRWARSFHLAFDRDVYKIFDSKRHASKFLPARTDPIRLAVYARAHTDRRCVALVLGALELLGRRFAQIEVHFFGQADLAISASNFAAIWHGVLTPEELAELYNACDIGICLSATNYSLVPKEMMACGLALVELDSESTRAIFNPSTVTLAGPHPRSIAEAITQLASDPCKRQTQADAGREWASRFDWDAAGEAVEVAFKDYLAELCPTLASPTVARRPDALLDVVIPTWNGMSELPSVIASLRDQTVAADMRIHCIDSSSTDGTTEWLRKQPEIDLFVIPQSEFQHGRTRNVAAGKGEAPIIAFLTQDAIPATRRWAEDILKMMEHFPQAAGLFGRHIAHPHHPTHVRQEIHDHFNNLARFPLALSKETDPVKWASGDRSWRQVLHFYSDNNSAMRRSVWERHPYPEIPYGEDQVWARDIIEEGRVKLYAPTAAVWHSHDYGPKETFARARTESAFFFQHFGYVLGTDDEDEMEAAIARERSVFRHWARCHNIGEDEIDRQIGNIKAKHHGWRAGRNVGETQMKPCAGKVGVG